MAGGIENLAHAADELANWSVSFQTRHVGRFGDADSVQAVEEAAERDCVVLDGSSSGGLVHIVPAMLLSQAAARCRASSRDSQRAIFEKKLVSPKLVVADDVTEDGWNGRV
ncbi:hypothetical protein ColKHC_10358 [Colletotrichum higginsianum]|nr:hypothetical protein ColKHC_10358 [Colletotrichum higginsianum]